MRTRILRGGVMRYVHLVAAQLHKRMDTGEQLPLVGVRPCRRPQEVRIYRRVDILGNSSLAELTEPLPGTNGRGILPLVTEAPLRIYLD